MALVKSWRDSEPSPSLSNSVKALPMKGLLLSSSTEARVLISTWLPSLDILENLQLQAVELERCSVTSTFSRTTAARPAAVQGKHTFAAGAQSPSSSGRPGTRSLTQLPP